MASPAVIGALRVTLGADTAQFSSGLKGSKNQLASFGAAVAKVGAAVGVAIAGASVAIGVGVRRTITKMDEFAKASQSFGVPIEQLSRLEHAAELSGVSFGDLTKGIKTVSKNLADISAGAGAEAARAFDALGISVANSDGSLRSATDVMDDVADRFSRMEDGSAKTAVALGIFGRAGATMIPLLNQSAEGIAQMTAEADKLGLVIDAKTGAAAERFNDNLTRLGRVQDGVFRQLAAHMLPALERLSQGLIDAAVNGNLVQSVAGVLTRVFDGLQRAVRFTADNIAVLARVATVLIGIRLAAGIAGMGIAFVKFAKAVRIAGLATAAFNVITNASRFGILLIGSAIALAAGQFESFKSTVVNLGNKVREMIPDFGEGLVNAIKTLGLDTSALEGELSGLATENDHVAQTARDLQIAFSSASGGAKKMADTAKSAVEKLADLSGRVTSTIGSNFDRMVDGVIDGTFTARDALHSLTSDVAKMAASGLFKSLIGGVLTGGAGAGSPGLLGGLLPGFASGFSGRVGGAGGIDSQLVAFRGTPGERVEVGGSLAGGGTGMNIVMNNDFRGADAGAVAGIGAKLVQLERSLPAAIRGEIESAKIRKPGTFAGVHG